MYNRYYNNDEITVHDCYTGKMYCFTNNTVMQVDCREFGYNEILDLRINILFGNNYKNNYKNNDDKIKFTLLNKDRKDNINLISYCISFSFKDIISKFIYERTKIILDKSRAEHHYLYYDKEYENIFNNNNIELSYIKSISNNLSRAEHYYLYYDKEDKTYVKEYIEKLKNEANEFCKDVFKI